MGEISTEGESPNQDFALDVTDINKSRSDNRKETIDTDTIDTQNDSLVNTEPESTSDTLTELIAKQQRLRPYNLRSGKGI